jgi:hypothetical protein
MQYHALQGVMVLLKNSQRNNKKGITMKTTLLTLLLAFAAMAAKAQDYIVLNNGDKLKVKFVDKTPSQIMYRAFGLKTSPLKSIARGEVERIIFEDGTELMLSKPKETVEPPKLVQEITKANIEDPQVKAQPESFFKETNLTKEPLPPLTAMEMKVYRQGVLLNPLQVGDALISNPKALNIYNEGQSKLKTARSLAVSSYILSGSGLVISIIELNGGYVGGTGLLLALAGLGVGIPSVIIKGDAKQKITEATILYNSERGRRTSLIITPIIKANGIGICMRF